mmetsp:Transcript_37526/g.55244  ORF Transcript_37526/g.55244 Transcript_37526/m.55244 type:complete len:256 (+) Transcript_37526:1315-2082(+)
MYSMDPSCKSPSLSWSNARRNAIATSTSLTPNCTVMLFTSCDGGADDPSSNDATSSLPNEFVSMIWPTATTNSICSSFHFSSFIKVCAAIGSNARKSVNVSKPIIFKVNTETPSTISAFNGIVRDRSVSKSVDRMRTLTPRSSPLVSALGPVGSTSMPPSLLLTWSRPILNKPPALSLNSVKSIKLMLFGTAIEFCADTGSTCSCSKWRCSTATTTNIACTATEPAKRNDSTRLSVNAGAVLNGLCRSKGSKSGS